MTFRFLKHGRFWLGSLMLLFLLAALLFGWGWWRWQHLANPGAQDQRAWQVAPAESAFFYLVPNVPKFYHRFYRYHSETLSSPTLVAAKKSAAHNPLLAPSPNQPIPPALFDLMNHFGKVALFDFFTALLPPSSNNDQFRFLIGGQCLSPWLSEASFVQSTQEVSRYTWNKETRDGITTRTAEHDGQTIRLLTMGDWLLLSNDWPTLQQAVRAIRGESKQTLGMEQPFQQSRDFSLRQALIWIYANPSQIADAAESMQTPSLATAVRAMTPGLQAASWGWHSQGPRGVGYDLVSFTLEAPIIQAAQQALLPIDASRFDATTSTSLWAMTGSAHLDRLNAWPILRSDRLKPLASLMGKADPTNFFFQIQRDPDSGRRDLKWDFQPEPAESPDPPAWVTQAATLEGAEQPFFEVRIDYRGIVNALQEEVKKDWPKWQQALQAKGWPAPDSPPALDVDRYFAQSRVTAGFEQGHLVLYNAMQLRESGSTLLTALVTLTAGLAPEAMAARMETARRPFAELGGENAPQWANAMDISLISGLFLSPIFTRAHGGNLAIDIIMLEVLASGLDEPISKN